MPVTRRPISSDLGSSGCWRENASRRCVNDSARRAPRIALFGRPLQSINIGPLLLQVTLQRFQIADNDGQQVVEIMGDAAGELADAFHLL